MVYLGILAVWFVGSAGLAWLVGKIIKRADEERKRSRDVWAERPQMWLERNPYDAS